MYLQPIARFEGLLRFSPFLFKAHRRCPIILEGFLNRRICSQMNLLVSAVHTQGHRPSLRVVLQNLSPREIRPSVERLPGILINIPPEARAQRLCEGSGIHEFSIQDAQGSSWHHLLACHFAHLGRPPKFPSAAIVIVIDLYSELAQRVLQLLLSRILHLHDFTRVGHGGRVNP